MTAPKITSPIVKGYCPGALRPMMSGDGLIVRVKPLMGRLSRDQVLGLCDIADQFGNGTIDVTSRANLQIRGVAQHGLVVAALRDLGVLDSDAVTESRRNILIAPLAVSDASGGSISGKMKTQAALHDRLVARVRDWPDLPNKMGIAIDLGDARMLAGASADFRFEGSDHGMILRADGVETGVAVTLDTAADVLLDLMQWFADSGGPMAGRMARHLQSTALPDRFCGIAPKGSAPVPRPGVYGSDVLVGVAFGQATTADLRRVMDNAAGMRPTPWKMLLIEDSHDPGRFVMDADDPLLRIHACVGAPGCAQAVQDTRHLAQQLAPHMADRSVHVAGCAKGCAHPRATDVAIVGTKDGYDLVRNGRACDIPAQRGLTPEDIIEDLTDAL